MTVTSIQLVEKDQLWLGFFICMKEVEHEWWKYVYDEFCNCIICPEYQMLYKHRKETIEQDF